MLICAALAMPIQPHAAAARSPVEPRAVVASSDHSVSPTSDVAVQQLSRDFDRWYSLELQSCHAGWAHWIQTTTATTISTKLTMRLELRRMGQVVVLESESEFIETLAGKPVSQTIVESLGAEPKTRSYRYSDNGINVTVTLGKDGAPSTSERPVIEGTWLTPAAAAVFVAQRLEAGAKDIAVRTVELGAGPDPVMVTRQVIERATVESMGKTVKAHKVTTSSARKNSGQITELIDEQGAIISSVLRMGEMQLAMTLTDAASAKAKLNPPELFSWMLVKSSRAIEMPRQRTHGTYILTQSAGQNNGLPAPTNQPQTHSPGASAPAAAPSPSELKVAPDHPLASSVTSTCVQSVEAVDAGTVRVTVSLDSRAPAPPGDLEDDQYRRTSVYIDSDNGDVGRIARQSVIAIGDSTANKAEAARRFVYKYITKKDLGVGFATAAEVARTKAGDCTEHAVLLAAMLRSLDIPARVVSGLVYMEAVGNDKNVFAYHMWTQALIEDAGVARWVDLDATLSAQRAFDATHIALLTTALNEDAPQDPLVKLVPLLGRLRIEVVGPAKDNGK